MMRDQARREIGAWPIRREKLSDLAAQRLEALIRDGTFPTGTMLAPERGLMKGFHVGRTSIREALCALHCQGRIRRRTGERPKVATPAPETLITELSGAARSFLAQPGGGEDFLEERQE